MAQEPHFEELDAPARPAAEPRRERWLAAGLLLVVIAVGVAGWWRGEAGSAAYRRGAAAASARHWSDAQAAFATAGDWRDAPARAAEAGAQARQVARLYEQGRQAGARADWAAAAAAFAGAADISPYYQDVAAQLAGARDQLRRTGLAGIVALVEDGAQPGLYLEPEARYLPGSDGSSRVRAVAGDGRRFIYDQAPRVPPGSGPNLTLPTPAPRAGFWVPTPSPWQIRPAVLATLSPSGTVALQPLPDGIDGRGLGLFLGDTLWWYAPRNDFGYYSFTVSYYGLSDGARGMVVGSSGRDELIAWQPDGSRVLMASYGSVPPGSAPRPRLDVTDARATHLGTLGTVEGTVIDAGFSADGRYLFFQTASRGSLTQTLYLADLANLAQPRITPIRAQVTPGNTSAGMAAVWQGPQPQLLVDTWTAAGEHLFTFDPAIHAFTALWNGPSRPAVQDLATISPDGRQFALRYRTPTGQDNLRVAALQGSTRDVPIQLGPRDSVDLAFTPDGAHLIYSNYRLDFRPAARRMPVFSLATTGTAPPVRLGERDWDADLQTLALPRADSLAAIVTPQHELHAVTYDGRTDLLIASGVAAVWSLDTRPGPGWTH
jgi:hypothetical protein